MIRTARPSAIRQEIRRRWWLVGLCVLIGGACAGVISRLQPRSYSATTTIYVREVFNKYLSPLLVKSYADAAVTTNVLSTGAHHISHRLERAVRDDPFSVLVPPGTALVQLRVPGSTRAQTAARASAIDAAFQSEVSRASLGAISVVDVSTTIGVLPRRTLSALLVGVMGGLVFAGTLFLALWRRAPPTIYQSVRPVDPPTARRTVDRARLAAAAVVALAVPLSVVTGHRIFVEFAGAIVGLGVLLWVRVVNLPAIALLAFVVIPEAGLPRHGTLSPGLVVMLIFFIRVLHDDRMIRRTRHLAPLVGLTAWMAYRALFSSSVATSGAWLVAFVGLVGLPAVTLPGWHEAQERVESAWLAAGGVLGVYGLVELALGHNPLSGIYGDTGLSADTVYRVTTTLGNPLLTGLFLCIAAFIGLGRLLREPSRLAALATLFSAVGMFATSTRGAALALGVGVALLLILRLQPHFLPQLRRTAALLAVAIVGLVVGGLYLRGRADSASASGSTAVRLETYQAGNYLVNDFWRWGAGPGLTDDIKYRMPYGNYQRGVESSAYEVLIELGLPGSILFCWVLLSAAASAARARPELAAAIFAFVVSASTFDLLDEFRPSLLLLGLLIGVAANPRRLPETLTASRVVQAQNRAVSSLSLGASPRARRSVDLA